MNSKVQDTDHVEVTIIDDLVEVIGNIHTNGVDLNKSVEMVIGNDTKEDELANIAQ